MTQRSYFFCGIGGSGMLPLAMFLKGRGASVAGSDRAIDQGRADDVQRRLQEAGIAIAPQDGSGVRPGQVFVTSSAVEATIPDVAAARTLGLEHIIRAELLSRLTNDAPLSCGIAGTSGKSTTTAMLAHILAETGRDPAVVNGAPILNFRDGEGRALGWRNGEGPFVCEVDESDGSIARYNPSVGVILNISEDHKPMAELKSLFGFYGARSGLAILGIDSEPVLAVRDMLPRDKVVTFSLGGDADYSARDVSSSADGLKADILTPEGKVALFLPMMGRFNIANALAATAAAAQLGVSPGESAAALSLFKGSARRLQTLGTARGITVVDDFAHNPEKISASISALRSHHARLHIFYQPHGYGPLATFRQLYEEAFRHSLGPDDKLFVSEPAFFGGTVTRTDDARAMTAALRTSGIDACFAPHRDVYLESLVHARAGDAVVVMGARDDSLTTFAHQCLQTLGAGA